MSLHARRQILNAVKTVLTPSFTDVRVAGQYNVERKTESAIVHIDWTSENIEHLTIMGTPNAQQRSLQVVIRLLRQAVDDVDLLVDADAEKLERVLQESTLTTVLDKWRLTSATKTLDSSGERPVAVIDFTYEAVYRVAANAPATILV